MYDRTTAQFIRPVTDPDLDARFRAEFYALRDADTAARKRARPHHIRLPGDDANIRARALASIGRFVRIA